MHERELIQGLQEGREDAFEKLVSMYQVRVYNTVLGLLQQPQDAEEITQDVFIKVFENISRFREEAQLGTWIYKIAVRQALDFLRRKKRKKRSGGLFSIFDKKEEIVDLPDFYHPGVQEEQKELANILFKAVSLLPEQQKGAFLLQKLEGLGQGEIADILQTSESAVESLLFRAKANLRKSLGEYYKKHYE